VPVVTDIEADLRAMALRDRLWVLALRVRLVVERTKFAATEARRQAAFSRWLAARARGPMRRRKPDAAPPGGQVLPFRRPNHRRIRAT
jgi:hypothetical protein